MQGRPELSDRLYVRRLARQASWERLEEVAEIVEDEWLAAGDREDSDTQIEWEASLDILHREIERRRMDHQVCVTVAPSPRRRGSHRRKLVQGRTHRPRTRRTASSSRTSSADPGDDGGHQPGPVCDDGRRWSA